MTRAKLAECSNVARNVVYDAVNGKPVSKESADKIALAMGLKPNGAFEYQERHGLPHINPHAFRHTMTSLLYFNGVDSVSISKRLGHAQVSTTCDIYSHVIAEADQRNADILEDIFLKKA